MVNYLTKIAVTTAATVLSFAAIGTSPAQSATITYNFEVGNLDGPLAGQTFSGNISFDDSAGPRFIRPFREPLSVSFNFLGENFDETDDVDFPLFPLVSFRGEVPPTVRPVLLDYYVAETDLATLTSRPRLNFSPIPNPVIAFFIFGTTFSYEVANTSFATAEEIVSSNLFRASATSTSIFSGEVTYQLNDEPLTSVPEPTTVVGLSFLCLGWLLQRKQQLSSK